MDLSNAMKYTEEELYDQSSNRAERSDGVAAIELSLNQNDIAKGMEMTGDHLNTATLLKEDGADENNHTFPSKNDL